MTNKKKEPDLEKIPERERHASEFCRALEKALQQIHREKRYEHAMKVIE